MQNQPDSANASHIGNALLWKLHSFHASTAVFSVLMKVKKECPCVKFIAGL
jgi:hypothetical protein